MPNPIKYFLLFLVLFACQPVIEETLEGKVIGISDGDTIKLLHKRKTLKIRLFGIDCPERNQAFGKKAKTFTATNTFEKHVSIIVHGKDRYGRILGEVLLPNGKNLNEELLENGYAWHYSRYSQSRKFDQLESSARKEKRGLWQDKDPIPPWEFRQNKKAYQLKH